MTETDYTHRVRASSFVAVVIAACSFVGAPAVAQEHKNRPPRLDVQKQVSANVGAELFLSLSTSDPDDDPLTFGAEGLPKSARFETRTGDLVWTPLPEDAGTHLVTFSVSDGELTTFALTRITVTERAPLELLSYQQELSVGQAWAMHLETNRDISEHVAFTVDGLPKGATLDNDQTLRWTPTEDQLGDHTITVHLQSKTERADVERVLHVRPIFEEWESYALPGLGYAGWYPLNAPEVGFASGPSFEVVVAQYVHRNDNVGPSHGRITLKADLLFPADNPNDVVLIYSASLALSLERNPQRNWLLPIFAVDAGGLYQKSLGDAVHVTPQLGIHLWQSRNIFITATAGYLLALPQTERLHGPRFNISGNFTFW